MPGQKRPLTPKDLLYIYDGTLDGFFCCVYESVYCRELPLAITPEGEAQPSLFSEKHIKTNEERALRVRSSVVQKIAPEAMQLLQAVYCSCMPEKELAMLRFLLLGYEKGNQVLLLLAHPQVAPLLEAQRHLQREAHLLRGFVRFSEYPGMLGAQITPKNFVLPYLAGHFAARFAEETFIIHDRTHAAALLYQDRKTQIFPVEGLQWPALSPTEEGYRSLWRTFYHTIAIKARENPTCRRGHMPKRYWPNMTEMQPLL